MFPPSFSSDPFPSYSLGGSEDVRGPTCHDTTAPDFGGPEAGNDSFFS